MDARLQRLIAKREAAAKQREELRESRKAIVDLADEESREDLSPEEDQEFRDLTDKIAEADDELSGLDERISELSDEAEREAKVTEGAAALKRARARAQVGQEERLYRRGGPHSYLRDLVKHQMRMDDDESAIERLRRHASEVRTEHRDLDRDDGDGGYFVPPKWLVEQFVDLARAGRPTANAVTNMPLPAGTDSINIPKVATGTATDVQDGDNTGVEETDLTDTSVPAPVRTIAGQQDVAVQLLEQSPVNFDEVIFRDLTADYATKVNAQVIGGSGSNGQVLGIRGTSSINTVAADTATVKAVYSNIADAIQQVHTGRFMPPSVIVMHPRRWGWFTAATDSDGRPLVTPNGHGPNNAAGLLNAVASEQVVGSIQGLPVLTDSSIPTDVDDPDTTATTETGDVILVLRASDLYLWESSLRTRVLPDVGSGTLTTRLQVYGYVAFTAARYPKSVSEVSGAGLDTPTF